MPANLDTLLLPERHRFSTGSVALDFVHTGGVGSTDELLHARADLDTWLTVLLAREVSAREKDLATAWALRDAIWRLTRRHLAGRPYRPRDLAVVNAAAEATPPAGRLEASGAVAAPTLSGRQALALIAADAVEVLSVHRRFRVRVCAAPDCQLLFYDSSRPGRRQWCSMARCGNLRKTRAYRVRAAHVAVD